MCLGGGGGGGSQQENKSQTTEIPARKMNKQTSPEDAEGEIGSKTEEDLIDKKKKGRKGLRIPLATGSSGVQVE